MIPQQDSSSRNRMREKKMVACGVFNGHIQNDVPRSTSHHIPSRTANRTSMRSAAFFSAFALAVAVPGTTGTGIVDAILAEGRPARSDEEPVRREMEERLAADRAALERFRPGYTFWKYVFTIPDGQIAFGSAQDGHLLASFPTRGDWDRGARWQDDSLAGVLDGVRLPQKVDERRDEVAQVLEREIGPVIHNPTRGGFLLPNARRYGAFLGEWGAIYERFGVPAEVGLAQAVVESGLSGKVKSEAKAIGFCQWLPRNWKRLDGLTPDPLEAENQTTQAPYCAAYLSVLATKYHSFIPALSEHHAGGANVGRTLINGQRLGGADVREQYFLGSDFAQDLRTLSPRTFRKVIGSYGPRSHLYAEMVFGNAATIEQIRTDTPQDQIYAIRTSRAFTMIEITQRTGLSAEKLKRYNPALARRVPKGANLYLPVQGGQFGTDVSFWHRPATDAYQAVLADFLALEATPDEWDQPSFDRVLADFRRRFRDTRSEEGAVMDVVLGYVMQEMPLTRRVLNEFRGSREVRDLFQQGVTQRAMAMAETGA
ncbi:MAG: hypothetical protein EXR95_03080 [Gemmatimonadetes bacterium]|nr:hypothetical protein [Gemmatimonadota bacterium]